MEVMWLLHTRFFTFYYLYMVEKVLHLGQIWTWRFWWICIFWGPLNNRMVFENTHYQYNSKIIYKIISKFFILHLYHMYKLLKTFYEDWNSRRTHPKNFNTLLSIDRIYLGPNLICLDCKNIHFQTYASSKINAWTAIIICLQGHIKIFRCIRVCEWKLLEVYFKMLYAISIPEKYTEQSKIT